MSSVQPVEIESSRIVGMDDHFDTEAETSEPWYANPYQSDLTQPMLTPELDTAFGQSSQQISFASLLEDEDRLSTINNMAASNAPAQAGAGGNELALGQVETGSAGSPKSVVDRLDPNMLKRMSFKAEDNQLLLMAGTIAMPELGVFNSAMNAAKLIGLGTHPRTTAALVSTTFELASQLTEQVTTNVLNNKSAVPDLREISWPWVAAAATGTAWITPKLTTMFKYLDEVDRVPEGLARYLPPNSTAAQATQLDGANGVLEGYLPAAKYALGLGAGWGTMQTLNHLGETETGHAVNNEFGLKELDPNAPLTAWGHY